MTKKELRYKRMIRHFTQAVWAIADSEGMDAVTARKVADMAGYNVATLYNYFDNLNHLMFFASFRALKDYAMALPEQTHGMDDPLLVYIKTWECFNYFAYKDPLYYKNIFLGEHTAKYNQAIQLYYDVFPEELPSDGLQFLPMFREGDLYERDFVLLSAAAKSGNFGLENVRDISNMNVILFSGMLHRFLTSEGKQTPKDAAKATTRYQARTLMAYGISKELLKDYL
ncbi:MAG: TetR/AcrR family transcriptional regulator [Coprococcus sp.]|nr:TetR/AcrR family transcriptional regulator [Coprococcus sp.]